MAKAQKEGEKEQQLQDRERALVQKEQRLQEREQALAEKEQLQATNGKKDQEITQLKEQLETQKANLSQKEQELQAANEKLLVLEVQLQAKEQAEGEKDTQIKEQKQKLDLTEAENKQLNEQLSDKSKQLQEMNQKLVLGVCIKSNYYQIKSLVEKHNELMKIHNLLKARFGKLQKEEINLDSDSSIQSSLSLKDESFRISQIRNQSGAEKESARDLQKIVLDSVIKVQQELEALGANVNKHTKIFQSSYGDLKQRMDESKKGNSSRSL